MRFYPIWGKTHKTHEQGMVLIIVLLLLSLISVLISHLLLSLPIRTQLASNFSASIQQFQAAEAGLQETEKQLTQLLLEGLAIKENTIDLMPIHYAGYNIRVTVKRFSEPICVIPHHRQGHYYQLTATALASQEADNGPLVCLRSTVVLPDNKPCLDKLSTRTYGRTSWCQLR